VTGSNNTFYFKYCGKDPEQEKKIVAILNAISESDAKLDAVMEAIAPPKFVYLPPDPISVPPGANPRASVKFIIDGPDPRGQLELVCDRACSPVRACALMGENPTRLATVSSDPNLSEFIFRRQFPPFTQCQLTVESRDSNPVKVISIGFSKRGLDELVPNVVQPNPCVVGGGSVMC
jgi:hypothetical protein